MNPLTLDLIDTNIITSFKNRDHSAFYSNYSLNKKWVSYIQTTFPDIFQNSLIIKITNNKLIYEKDFKLEVDPCKITCFILEIRSDLIPYKHLNAMIIDSGKVYRYEPYGSIDSINLMYNYKLVDAFLEQFFNGLDLDLDLSYYGPTSYQMTLGPQTIEEIVKQEHEGFCTAWSLMFIHLKLLNKDKPVEEVDRILCSHLDHKKLIFAYVTFLERL